MKRRDFLKGLVGTGAVVAVTAPSAKHGGDWIEIDCRGSGTHILGVRLVWDKGKKPPMTMMEIHVEGDEDKDNEYHWNCRERSLFGFDELQFHIKCTQPPMNHVLKLRLHERLGTMDQLAFESVPRDSYKVYTRMIPQSSELAGIYGEDRIFSQGIYYRWKELGA